LQALNVTVTMFHCRAYFNRTEAIGFALALGRICMQLKRMSIKVRYQVRKKSRS